MVNIGAGSGSYEPRGRQVVAVEPSVEMIRQRPPGSAPALRGVAGALPFPRHAFDAAMAILTVHHWPDIRAGLAEMRRVSARQVVVSWDVDVFAERFWFTRDYLRAAGKDEHPGADASRLAAQLRDAVVQPLPVPHDCTDGFFAAYWRRPEAYLDPAVRASISAFALREESELAGPLARLDADLTSGAWHRRYAALLELAELDVGYRLIVGGET